MRLILGDNLQKPSIRDIILIGSFQQDLSTNRKLLRLVGRSEFSKMRYTLKYGGKFGDKIVKFGKTFYNKVLQPGYSKVLKPVYNATKKIIEFAANNDIANNAIKVVGNMVGSALGAPGVGNILAAAAKGTDSALKIGESVVNELFDKKKLDVKDVKEIVDIIREQIKEFMGKDKEQLEKKVENVEENLKDLDLEKEDVTKEDIKEGVNAGLIFYNPVNRQMIKKYAGRVKLGGSLKPINPKILKILPKLLNKRRLINKIRPATIGIDKPNRFNDVPDNLKGGRARMSGRAKMSGRVRMSGNIGDDITSKLEALKSKYK